MTAHYRQSRPHAPGLSQTLNTVTCLPSQRQGRVRRMLKRRRMRRRRLLLQTLQILPWWGKPTHPPPGHRQQPYSRNEHHRWKSSLTVFLSRQPPDHHQHLSDNSGTDKRCHKTLIARWERDKLQWGAMFLPNAANLPEELTSHPTELDMASLTRSQSLILQSAMIGRPEEQLLLQHLRLRETCEKPDLSQRELCDRQPRRQPPSL